jgi:hypothetical protein
MLGKILPYVFVGYVQTMASHPRRCPRLVFGVPFDGSWPSGPSSSASTCSSSSIWRSAS